MNRSAGVGTRVVNPATGKTSRGSQWVEASRSVAQGPPFDQNFEPVTVAPVSDHLWAQVAQELRRTADHVGDDSDVTIYVTLDAPAPGMLSAGITLDEPRHEPFPFEAHRAPKSEIRSVIEARLAELEITGPPDAETPADFDLGYFGSRGISE